MLIFEQGKITCPNMVDFGFKQHPPKSARLICFQGSVEGGPMCPEQAGNFCNRLAVLFDELAGMSDLLDRKDRGRSKTHPARLGCDTARGWCARRTGTVRSQPSLQQIE
jgi:hypothetical protein